MISLFVFLFLFIYISISILFHYCTHRLQWFDNVVPWSRHWILSNFWGNPQARVAHRGIFTEFCNWDRWSNVIILRPGKKKKYDKCCIHPTSMSLSWGVSATSQIVNNAEIHPTPPYPIPLEFRLLFLISCFWITFCSLANIKLIWHKALLILFFQERCK